LESLTRFDIYSGELRMSFNNLTIQPNNVWSWSIGHFYLRDDISTSPTALGLGTDTLISTIFYRFTENWGFRASHRYDLRRDALQEQAYTAYRDFRSWTGALTLRIRDRQNVEDDFTVAFTVSLKAFPRSGLDTDVVKPHTLWGY
jgi:hypothetical protein